VRGFVAKKSRNFDPDYNHLMDDTSQSEASSDEDDEV
jgi:hypothetical protein